MNPRAQTTQDWIQGFVWRLELSGGPNILKLCGCLLGFVILAVCFNWRVNHGFSNPEAMESAQLGRRLAAGAGYTTYSIRPSTLGLLERADPEREPETQARSVPDLNIAPGYPIVLAGVMKILPFNFAANPNTIRSYQPESLIIGFNDFLFFLSILLLFNLAKRLFDSEVAWISAIIFAGSEIYWKFSASGLSTMWLLVIVLAVARCLIALEEREREEPEASRGGSIALAIVVGALVGIGGLSRYSLAWLVIPVLLFIGVFLKRRRAGMLFATLLAFALVMTPWIARNFKISETPFGMAGYSILENTRPYEEDRVERSIDPFAAGLSHLTPRDIVNKLIVNEGKMLKNDFPRLGGNWVWSFFLCSLLIPIKHEGSRRLRYFLIGSLALLAIVQPLGQTHLSLDAPEINSENLLILVAPLILVFGVGFFLTLLDQIEFPTLRIRRGVAMLFAGAMFAPLALELAGPGDEEAPSAYAPFYIQRTAELMHPNELMMSDIPWAVAWYGNRPCAWLTVSTASSFEELDRRAPVHAIYLTQRTSDRPLFSRILANRHSWEYFEYNSLPETVWPQGAVPPGFRLTNAPPGYRPSQLFISDEVRWKTAASR
ncbi:MAG TPA: glycosyltransferase family 39 protein [Verrucomicrobiae bacterium]|jgi:4-amino-4-deoxy-L-arabinose transferase-like glycosyltransferase